MSVVQDNYRENKLTDLCGLMPIPGRLGADATDEYGNLFELKSTSKAGVSTARDFHQGTINKYKKCYWVVGVFDCKKQDHDDLFSEIYFLAPNHMQQWYESQERALKQYDIVCDRVMGLIHKDLDHEETQLLRGILVRGSKRNDPNISMNYIKKNSYKIDKQQNVYQQIRTLIEKFPIENEKIETDEFSFDIFF